MALQRRRHRLTPAIRTKTIMFAAVLVVVVFIVFLSLFTPLIEIDGHSLAEPVHRIRDRPRRSFRDLQKQHYPGNKRNAVSDAWQVGAQPIVFHVPNEGGNTKYDLWGSKLSNYYYGCSNASKKFAAAEVITHPNRYLMIATSGGLNQQRTGVSIYPIV